VRTWTFTGLDARPLDQLASTLSSRHVTARLRPKPSARAVKHDGHSIRTARTRQNHHAGPCGTRCRFKRPNHPEPANEASDPKPKPRTKHPIHNRIESLFTMSKSQMLLHEAEAGHCRPQGASSAKLVLASTLSGKPACATPMVEPDGIEPTTSCLQSRRSPS
jgi:hypothetical protein